jgi:hypothetical protein
MTEMNDYMNILDTVMRITNLWRCTADLFSCPELPNVESYIELDGFIFFPLS